MYDRDSELSSWVKPGMPRDERVPVPTPWEDLTAVLDLTFRHKAGIVAGQGTAEARAGQDIAVHAAEQGLPVILYTTRPPADIPPLLVVDQKAHPTSDHVKDRTAYPPQGRKPHLIVIEDYQRLRPRERHIPDQYDPVDDPVDDPDYYPLSAADELLWTIREILIDIPLLLTTTIAQEPDTSRPLDQWLRPSHPAVVLTDICKPVLLLHRTNQQTVEARLEGGPYGPAGLLTTLNWPTGA
ncbi:hypothetical protein ACFYXP_38135 [Streptomyces sp. NPDC002466]|uniref:hypothetical protein n=1 Tax=unclassified Streptomyces TaxID=2593676 RepID=UPI0035D84D02